MILQGELKPDTPLPSIRQLAKDLQISVITTKRAYEELEREGLIHSLVGKGSFVSGVSPDFLREQRIRLLEDKLRDAVRDGLHIGWGPDDMLEVIRMLYEEESE